MTPDTERDIARLAAALELLAGLARKWSQALAIAMGAPELEASREEAKRLRERNQAEHARANALMSQAHERLEEVRRERDALSLKLAGERNRCARLRKRLRRKGGAT